MLAATTAWAGDPVWVVNDSNAIATHDCATQPRVVINGSHDRITLTGACAAIAVDGSDDAIVAESGDDVAVHGSVDTVDVGAVGRITIAGRANTITWRTALKGKKPKVSDQGTDNRVTQVLAP